MLGLLQPGMPASICMQHSSMAILSSLNLGRPGMDMKRLRHLVAKAAIYEHSNSPFAEDMSSPWMKRPMSSLNTDSCLVLLISFAIDDGCSC